MPATGHTLLLSVTQAYLTQPLLQEPFYLNS